MSINNSQRATWPMQLKATMTGSIVLIGALVENPVIIYMNNLGTVDVDIYVDDPTGSGDPWMTFFPGQAIAMDLRDKAHLASNFTADLGTSFYGDGASGDFAISYIAAKEY
jgi:hypothetical protein